MQAPSSFRGPASVRCCRSPAMPMAMATAPAMYPSKILPAARRSSLPTPTSSPILPHLPLPYRARTVAAAAAAGVPAEEGGEAGKKSPEDAKPGRQLLSIFTVFSDEKCNSKLLALALGQMLCSIATLIHDSYLPIYVHDELGLSTTEIGAVQGAAQFLCQLSKGVSGVVGDMLGSQTRVLVFGTALTLLCKPMFALLSSVYGVLGVTACLYWFFVAKLMDRLSKGIREAPTKAVMNELARESGDAPDAAYGLRQSLATAGMLIGSTIASLTFAATGQSYVLTFAVASIPPALALVWLIGNFREELFGAPAAKPPAATTDASVPYKLPTPPPRPAATSNPVPTISTNASFSSLVSVDTPPETPASGTPPPAATPVGALPPPPPAASIAAGAAAAAAAAEPEPVLSPLQKALAILKAFKPAYWQALLVVAVLYFARFDASFLSLRAKAVMAKSMLPMLTLVNTLIQMLLTAPLARLSGTSTRARNRLLLAGFACMVAADACLGLEVFASPAGMFAGAACVGLHMALTHAITISMVSSYMPTGVIPGVGKLSGTAVSFTDLLLGFVLAASNTLAGMLADVTRQAGYGNVGCFAGGAAACVLSGLLLLAFERWGDLGKDELVMRRAKKAKAA